MTRAIPAPVREAARDGEPDRYLAALLSPQPIRADLAAIAAFGAEIARIPLLIREPMMGEIRLQWWRDVLSRSAGEGGTARGHPVADAICEVVSRQPVPLALLVGVIDAHAGDLQHVLPEDEGALRASLAKKEGALLEAAWIVAGLARTTATDALLSEAGFAYGLARALARLPRHLAHGGLPLPRRRLIAAGILSEPPWPEGPPPGLAAIVEGMRGEARAALGRVRSRLSGLPAEAHDVLLPLAMVEPYLEVQTPVDDSPSAGIDEPSPLRRAWRLWRAHRRRRV